jgi:hypothetical protein
MNSETILKKYNEFFMEEKNVNENNLDLIPSVSESLLRPDLKQKDTLMTLEEFNEIFPEYK